MKQTTKLGSNSSIPDTAGLIKLNPKRRKSLLDTLNAVEQEIVQQSVVPQIVIPQSIGVSHVNDTVQSISEATAMEDKLQKLRRLREFRRKKSGLVDLQSSQPPQVITKEENIQKIQEIEILDGVVLPENINVVQLEAELDEAFAEIPGAENLSFADVKVITGTRKDKTGYYKTKTVIKDVPEVLNIISSYVKDQSKGLLIPRKCDARVIANTNKTQLKSSNIKLSIYTVVFKPDFNKLKVNKGTRFMISTAPSFESTGNLIIYIQESRAKFIMEISRSTFECQEFFDEFIGDRIAEYYVLGFEAVKHKIQYRDVNNPLMKIVNDIVKTGEYFSKIYSDDETGHIYSIDLFNKHSDNQWLYANIIEGQVSGTYDLVLKNRVDESWVFKPTTKVWSLSNLRSELYEILDNSFKTKWNLTEEIPEEYYQLDNLRYKKLREAFMEIFELFETEPKLSIKIGKTLSRAETAKAINKTYEAECIIGKTGFVDYFILSYLAFQVVGGDKRRGQQYITTPEYREKYGVNDDRQYQKRGRTILKKEGESRNYNSRPYIFQLEYSINGKVCIYRSKDFAKVCELTGFLTEQPKDASTQTEY